MNTMLRTLIIATNVDYLKHDVEGLEISYCPIILTCKCLKLVRVD